MRKLFLLILSLIALVSVSAHEFEFPPIKAVTIEPVAYHIDYAKQMIVEPIFIVEEQTLAVVRLCDEGVTSHQVAQPLLCFSLEERLNTMSERKAGLNNNNLDYPFANYPNNISRGNNSRHRHNG